MTSADRPSSSGPADLRLHALTASAADLAGQFALAPLLARILRHAIDLLGCESGSICTVDEVAGTYRKEVDVGVGCLSGQTFPLDEGVTGEVVRARRSVIFDEYSDVRGGHISREDRASLHGVIGVPIRWDGAIIGACVVFSKEPGRRFTGEDTALVELFATHAAVAIANAKMHALAAQRERDAAIMAERERVVRDVHDTVGRGLATVLLALDSADRDLAGGGDPRHAIAAARTATRSALHETQRTVLGLGPALLDGRPLNEAIALELAWVQSTAAIETRLVVAGEPEALPADTARQLFRIVQESLTNVIEHARARHVRVGLVYGDRSVTALVEDDGRGFDLATITGRSSDHSRGLGLRTLTARARLLGGSLDVDSTPHWGTRVRAEIPYVSSEPVDTSQFRWRLLLVHENPIVRAGLVRLLGQVEPDIHIVGEISDAMQAVEAYSLLRPNVVLANLDLSRIDGVQLTAYLRAADPAAAVVLLIDSVTDDRIREAAQVGAIGLVEAGADPAVLARSILAAARGDSLLSAEFLSRFTASLTARDTHPLTAREREVRALVEQGLPDKRIAAELRISVKTVEKHVGAVLRKTGAANRTVLAGQSVPH
ncbi:hybrid sensor histidine kinase/response regulator transcription factor [Mycetocola manganoxydans]|nr:GAF domain-containing protein [Mycetocola manganoxydans]